MDQNVYRIDCSLFRPIPQPHIALASIKELIVLTFRSIAGYRYYYCKDHGEVCAYLFLKHNYLGHYAFMKKSDLLINPYKTMPAYRRQGYAARLLQQAMVDAKKDGYTLYTIVTHCNLASQSALLKAVFRKIGCVDYRRRWFNTAQQFITSKQTSLQIFAFGDNGNNNSIGED